MTDMHNIFRRPGAQTWSVRFHIPRERREDVGRAFGSKTGHMAEVVRTLRTTDRKEAVARRPKALELIRREIDHKLQDIGLPPLHGEWEPSWALAWAEGDALTAEALEARKAINQASQREDETEEVTIEDRQGRERTTTMRTSARDRLINDMMDVLSDRADELREAGRNAGQYIDRYKAIALGEATPIGDIFDRWLRDIEGTVRKQTIRGHHLSIRLLGEYLMAEDGHPDGDGDGEGEGDAYVRQTAIEAITRRRIGAFPEWLGQERGLQAVTIQNRISPLKTFWDWAERRGYIEGVNPWLGATTGLKRRAEIQQQDPEDRKRPFTEAEMIALLKADPDEGRRWKYGPAIHDLMRLALLTGARQNELCSLTKGRVQPPQGAGSGLWTIRVTSEVAKTRNAQRLMPVHPLLQPIIERRLAALPFDAPDDTPLFPELPPGGPDGKRSWTFSKRFGDFRGRTLGPDKTADFHSFRRTFATYFENARGHGEAACTDLIGDHLMGHVPQSLRKGTYAAKELDWPLYERAIVGMVEKGMPEAVRRALSDTAGP